MYICVCVCMLCVCECNTLCCVCSSSQVSVIRGRVLTPDGSAVVGVRVTVVTQPLYGFTLTREQGWYVTFVE